MNTRRGRRISGVENGYLDPCFSVEMSRGYSTTTPRVRDDASALHEFGPFHRVSRWSTYLGNCKKTYWRGRTVIFPLAYINIIAWYLNLIPDAVRQDFGSVDKPFLCMPSYVASFNTLTLFSNPNPGFVGNKVEKLLGTVDKHLHRLHLPTDVRNANENDIFYAKITPDTHPGLITRKVAKGFSKGNLGGYNRIAKAHLVWTTVNDLIRRWDVISSGKIGKTVGTYSIGSREKISKVEPGEAVDARPLWIPEMIDLLHGSTWLELFKEYWAKYGVFRSEIWIGHSDTKLRYYRRLELDIKFKYSFEFDGKLWDSSVLTALIVKSFNVYASCFVQTKALVNHFNFLCDTFVLKRVVLHNGNTFLVTNGVPSGHAWTTQINSMANWILWTITIHNCPEFSQEFRRDYALQIMGDDVGLHSNVDLTPEQRVRICEWMLTNLNYKAKDETSQSDKTKITTTNDASSFLKRYTNVQGQLETKIKDIWKKLLFGPEINSVRRRRMTYFYRRISDFAIWNEKNRMQVALYMIFIKRLEQFLHERSFSRLLEKTHHFYVVLFSLTAGFTLNIKTIWEIFRTITNFDIKGLIKEASQLNQYIRLIYKRNYWSYDDSVEYVDYWKERKRSTTVSKYLRNSDVVPIILPVSMLEKLHGPYMDSNEIKRLRTARGKKKLSKTKRS